MIASSSGWLPFFLADLDHAGDLVRFSFAHEVRDRRVDHQNFERGNAARLVDSLEKVLRDHALERFRQRRANLVLLIGRENVDDTIDGFGRARGVQRSENKVTGGRRGQRQLDRFQVAHFADENDVRVFAQRSAQRVGKGTGVHADFAMLNETVLAAMHEFDRIFDRDDVIVPLQVGVIDHRRERGRFTGTGRTGHEHETLLQHRKFFQDRRQAELVDRQHLRWNETKHGRDAVFLLEEIGTVAQRRPGLRSRSRRRAFLRNVLIFSSGAIS